MGETLVAASGRTGAQSSNAEPMTAGRRRSRSYRSLFWRVFTTNAAVLGATAVITTLVFSPGIVSSPVAVTELVILAGGLVAMLLLNLVLMRRALAPLERLASRARSVDPLKPGQRVSVPERSSEASELAEAFNEMLERLETERLESGRRALEAQEAERLHIAQELHDEVGQSLTAVLLQLGAVRKRAPEELNVPLAVAQETARSSLEDVRRIAQQLRPEALDELGLVSALTAFSERLAEQAGLRVERALERNLPPLSYEEELVIYRVAQEALTNVVRHAEATRVELSLEREADTLRLCVRDDGRGLEGGSKPSAAGVRGMRERALMIGADLSIENAPRGGVEVRLDLSLDEGETWSR